MNARLVVACATLWLGACMATPEPRERPACTPGLTASCSCGDGAQGVHNCTVGGDAYGPCRCTAPGADAPASAPATDAAVPQVQVPAEQPLVSDGEAGQAAPPPDRSARPALALPAGAHTLRIQHGGRERVFSLRVPDDYDNESPIALLVTLHGLTQERVGFDAMTLYAEKGAREGFAVATPDGVDRSWNGGAACCGNASAFAVDDVGFVRALVAEVQSAVWIDATRIYAAGFSNGSFLAHRLGCEASDLFAAVAGVAGGLSIPDVMPGCAPGHGVPVVSYFGTSDPSFGALSDSTYQRWKDLDQCTDAGDVSYQKGVATCTTHSACRDGVELTRCILQGVDHCWPGAPCALAQSSDLDATEHSWAFLSRFQRTTP